MTQYVKKYVEIEIDREDMLSLTRRMTLKRTSMTRVAGAYIDPEGFIEGTFNTRFLKLSIPERVKNLEIAKAIPFADTNRNLKRYRMPNKNGVKDSLWQLLLGVRAAGLENDSLLDIFYEMMAEKYQSDQEYGVFLYHDRYDIPWAAHLARIIGEAYRCIGYTVKVRGRTCTASFIGVEDDVRLCNEIFRYAVGCIRAGIKEIRKCAIHMPPQELHRQCDSFGYGFAYGIKSAFQDQDEEKPAEWSLALSMPPKVRKVLDSFAFGDDFHAGVESSLSRDAFTKGMDEGKRFAPGKQIGDME